MKLLNNLFYANKTVNVTLTFFSFYCLTLLLFRAKITNSIYLFFLIWNLLLAIIPYAITSYLTTQQIVFKSKSIQFIIGCIWLLFLPNSFYIVTDLVHIVKSNGNLFYLDLVIICSFATIGFLLGLHSLIQFENLIEYKTSHIIRSILITIICLLCGFGIFLGRILRYNSWDVIHHPFELVIDLFISAISAEAILFSSLFGTFIYISYLLKKNKI